VSGPTYHSQIRGEPFNRLTHIANDVGKFLEQHPDHLASDQAIIIIEDQTDVGSMLFNYTDTADVLTTLLYMVKSVLGAVGKKMQVAFDDEEPIDL
jgi:hypothetical protein